MPPEGQANLSPKGVCNVVNRQLAEAGPRQLSQQVVRHPPPVLSELGCLALCFMDIAITHEILAGMPRGTEQPDSVETSRPEWFAAFLADRGTRKPSAHTLKAYRQDFDAIATLFADGEDLSGMALAAITVDTLRTAFARYAETQEAASIQRCWSTWNVLCTYLYTAERIGSNPMPMVGRPKLAKTLPKALPADAVASSFAARLSPQSKPMQNARKIADATMQKIATTQVNAINTSARS